MVDKMSESVGESLKEMAPDVEAILKATKQVGGEDLAEKMKLLGMQMQKMDPEEKAKHTGSFDQLGKTLSKLRKVLQRKMLEADGWDWTVYVCITVLTLIYAFFGYKLYKSLVERDRKREEKLKAKQSKKKK